MSRTFRLDERVVEVLCNRGSPDRPQWTVGSGFVVTGRRVLTAAHNVGASGELIVRFGGKREHQAAVCALPDGALAHDRTLDIAVLEIRDSIPMRRAVTFARIDPRPHVGTANIERCWAVGFPRYQEKWRDGRDRPVRESARVDGSILMGEGLVEGRPTFAVSRSPRPLPEGNVAQSEWQGISGSVVFAGELALGIVTEHHRAAGGGSLTVAPIGLLDELANAAAWWDLLAVDDAARLPVLPAAAAGPLAEPLDFGLRRTAHQEAFTGRAWLFENVAGWLAADSDGALLIVGVPGSGKSAIAAELAAGRCGPVAAHHFCRADNRTTLDPVRFVRSVAAMIALNVPAYDRLVRSRPAVTEALVEAQVAADPAAAFGLGVLGPLHDINPPPERQLLVIDALDEAVTGGFDVTIVDVLGPRAAQLPRWLKLVATTRPDGAVRRRMRNPNEIVIDVGGADNESDLRSYVGMRLAGSRLRDLVGRTGRDVSKVTDSVLSISAGVFLVASTLLTSIETGQLTLDDLSALPPGLGSFYDELFRRLFARPNDDYGPSRAVLEVLVAAAEPLTRREIGEVTAMDDEIDLPPVLNRLRTLLTVQDGRYQPFHRSLVEWLTSFDDATDEPVAGPFVVSPRRGHVQLSDWCRRAAPPAYRVRYLVTHLAGARRQDALFAAMTDWRHLSDVVAGRHGAGTSAFDVLADLRTTIAALRPGSSDRIVMEELEAAVRVEAHFLSRHPYALLQTLWNRCWWISQLDDEEIFAGPSSGTPSSHAEAGGRLVRLLEQWRRADADREWLRAVWPYPDLTLPILVRIDDLMPGPVALSPDARTLVSGERAVTWWDADTGAKRATYEMSGDAWARSLAYASDEILLVGTGSGHLLVIDAMTQRLRRAIEVAEGAPVRVAPLPGDRAAVSTSDGLLAVFDLRNGACVEQVATRRDLSAISASPDGSEIVVGADDDPWIASYAVGDLASGPTGARDIELGGVTGAAVGRDIVAWSEYGAWRVDGEVVIQTRDDEHRVPMPPGMRADGVVVVNDSRHLICAAGDAFSMSSLLVVEAESGTVEAVAPCHPGGIEHLVTDRGGRRIATAADESGILVWDAMRLASGDFRVTRSPRPTLARFLPDGRLLLASKHSDAVTVMDVANARLERELPGHAGGVVGLSVADDGRVACACGDGKVMVWDPRTWRYVVVTQHDAMAKAVTWSWDGSLLVSGAENGSVTFSEPLRERTVWSAPPNEHAVGHIALSADGALCAIARSQHTEVWSFAEQAVVRTTRPFPFGMAFTADGDQLVYRASGCEIGAIDLETGADLDVDATHQATWLGALGCRVNRWTWRFPWAAGGPTDMTLVDLRTGKEVAVFPAPAEDAVPDRSGRTWALLFKMQLYVLTLEDQ